MPVIRSFDECLQFVGRTGVVNIGMAPGWIPWWQAEACAVCDKLLHMSGQRSWFRKTFRPFRAVYHASDQRFSITQETGT